MNTVSTNTVSSEKVKKGGLCLSFLNIFHNSELNDKGENHAERALHIHKEDSSLSKTPKNDEEGSLKPKATASSVSFFELFKFATFIEKLLICAGVGSASIVGVCEPILAILFGKLVNAFVYDESYLVAISQQANLTINELKLQLQVNDFMEQIYINGLGIIIFGVVQLILGYAFVSCLNRVAESQASRLRAMFFHNILRQEMSWFDTTSTNDFASRVNVDINKIQEGTGEKIGMFIMFFVTFWSSIIIGFIFGWKLTLVLLTALPLLAISTAIITKLQTSFTAMELREYSKAGSIAEEVISGIRTVLAFGGENKELERYEERLKSAKLTGVKKGLANGFGLSLLWLSVYASYALSFWYGTKLVLDSRPPEGNNEYDPARLVTVIFCILVGGMSFGQAAPYLEFINGARGAASSVFEVIERQSKLDPLEKGRKRLSRLEGEVELKDVFFTYPSRPEIEVLRNINIKIKAGQTAALVGCSGCGKSTCVQLIQRFYDPTSGVVTVDNEDVRELNLGWLRDQIGVVCQEPVLFATSIADNIRLGKVDASFDDIVEAAKLAYAHNFIMKLPKKYDTQVGDRGCQLSGGQKQRIAIARALIKRPKILILDEATSALDNHSESIVQRALEKNKEGRTTILVAHRLTTVRDADVIIALNNGTVMESGSHEELMATKGLYYSLVMKQLLDEEPNEESDIEGFEQQEGADGDLNLNESPQSIGTDQIKQKKSRRRRLSSSSYLSYIENAFLEEDNNKEVLEKVKEEADGALLMELLKKNAPEWLYILGGSLAAAVQGTSLPLYAILFGDVIGSYFFAVAGESLTMRLRKESFEAILYQKIGWFDQEKNSTAALCSRLSSDASAVQGATGLRIGIVIQALVTLFLSVCLSLYFNWKLGLAILPFVPFVLTSVYYQFKILNGESVSEAQTLLKTDQIAIDAVNNIRTVASLHKEEHFAHWYSSVVKSSRLRIAKKSHIRGFVFGLALAIPFFAYGVVMLYGGYLVSQKSIHYEDVFKVGEALIMGTVMIGQAIAMSPDYNKARFAASRIFSLISSRTPTHTSLCSGQRIEKELKEVCVDDVFFSYPTRPQVPVLAGINLTVEIGQTLALVGPSGCGKSTIISLLERFYDPHSGTISINGDDIKKLNVSDLRQSFGLVCQEPILFDKTIAENVAYGDNSRDVLRSEIEVAAKLANIHEFIMSLPENYDTKVGAKGSQLSGGQKQRIAIARSLIRNPKLLLLDEATSALDTESEMVVQEALDEAQKGRTSVVVAHRLSTIQNSDLIAVINKGNVTECGSHEELMEQKQLYYSLYKKNK